MIDIYCYYDRGGDVAEVFKLQRSKNGELMWNHVGVTYTNVVSITFPGAFHLDSLKGRPYSWFRKKYKEGNLDLTEVSS